MRKILKKPIFAFILGIIITLSIGAYADYKYTSNEVSYGNKSVKEAIDDLYSKVLYKPGDVIYYDPVGNTTCTNYTSANSLNETKTGCLKWYVIADYKNSVAMILDHNTTYVKDWNTDNKNVSYEESDIKADIDALKSESEWALQPRLITAQEVANITGNTTWTNSGDWYCLGSNKQDNVGSLCAASTNKSYAWLFDYTYDCTKYGCNTADDSTQGYWTSTTKGSANSGSLVRHIRHMGLLGTVEAKLEVDGIRPVITISRSLLN